MKFYFTNYEFSSAKHLRSAVESTSVATNCSKESHSREKMKGLWSDHFPAAEKPPGTCSPCKTEGLWSEIFPAAEKSAPPSPPPPPLPRYERCLLCPTCNSAICRLLTSSTTLNPGRQFYTCPATDVGLLSFLILLCHCLFVSILLALFLR